LLLIEFATQELFGNIQTEDFVQIGIPDTLYL
jgi:hypothetical protein